MMPLFSRITFLFFIVLLLSTTVLTFSQSVDKEGDKDVTTAELEQQERTGGGFLADVSNRILFKNLKQVQDTSTNRGVEDIVSTKTATDTIDRRFANFDSLSRIRGSRFGTNFVLRTHEASSKMTSSRNSGMRKGGKKGKGKKGKGNTGKSAAKESVSMLWRTLSCLSF